MKPIPLFAGLLLGGLVIGAALSGWRRNVQPAPTSSSVATPSASTMDSTPPAPGPVISTELVATQPAQPATAEPSAINDNPGLQSHAAYVARRISELEDLSAENDAASLETILSELSNRDREIRHAAIQAAMQFGSRDAIPSLLEAAAQTDDPAEKTEFQQAADYLKLPSLTEVLAQQKNNPIPIKVPAQPPRHNVPSKKQTAPPPPP